MSTKRNRALKEYNGHNGAATIAHIENNIAKAYPQALAELTSAQYGRMMNIANLSYHDGRASTDAEKLDDDAVYVNGVGILVRQADGTWKVEK
jgi:hypothetical protein